MDTDPPERLHIRSLEWVLKNDKDFQQAVDGTEDGVFTKHYEKQDCRIYKKGDLYLKIEDLSGVPFDDTYVVMKRVMEHAPPHVMRVLYAKRFALLYHRAVCTLSVDAGENIRELVYFDPAFVKRMCVHLYKGLHALHTQVQAAHRDFHQTNFVYSEEQGAWNIIDMDWAIDLTKVGENEENLTFCHHEGFPLHTHPYVLAGPGRPIARGEEQRTRGCVRRFKRSYKLTHTRDIYIVMDHFQLVMSLLRYLRLEFPHFMYTGGQRSAERKRKMRLHTTFLDSAPKEVQRIGETLWAYVALVLAEEGARAEKMLHTFMDTLAEDVAHAPPPRASVETGIYDVAYDEQFRISFMRSPQTPVHSPATYSKRVRSPLPSPASPPLFSQAMRVQSPASPQAKRVRTKGQVTEFEIM
jgi:hypothetical protein